MQNCKNVKDNEVKSPKSEDRFRFANAYMGETRKSDMMFELESDGTRIPAHSLFVSAASGVLDKLIDSLNDGEIVIKVARCPRNEFMLLLRHIYVPGKENIFRIFC